MKSNQFLVAESISLLSVSAGEEVLWSQRFKIQHMELSSSSAQQYVSVIKFILPVLISLIS